MSYVRAFFRLLRHQPGLSLAAILTLGLGIALATTLSGIVYGLLLRPLPFPDADRLVAIRIEGGAIDAGRFRQWEEHAAAFENLAAYSMSYFFVTGTTGGTQAHPGAEITLGFLDLLPVSPSRGRLFLPEDMVPGAAPVALVSHRVWHELFGGRPDILGQPLRINRELHTVVGVMPRGFAFPHSQEVWRPLILPSGVAPGQGPSVEVVGRLRQGTTISQAAKSLNRWEESPRVRVEQFVDAHTDPRVRRALPLMGMAVLGILLIACVNVALLFLVRVLRQRHELAVAAALGAGRLRLPMRTVTEILGITGLGTLVGLGLAQGGIRLFQASMEPAGVFEPFWAQVQLDPAVVGFTLLIAVAASLLAAALPILHIQRTDPAAILREYSAGGSSRGVGRLSRALVLVELVLACSLLVPAGLMVVSVHELRGDVEGFDAEDLLTARVSIFQDEEAAGDGSLSFFQELTETLEADRRVERVAFASSIPTRGSFWSPLVVEGSVEATPERVRWLVVSDGLFEALDVPILVGRGLAKTDIALFSNVAVVNTSFADRFFPGQSSIGRRFQFPRDEAPWITIVGVVPDLVMGDVGDAQGQAAVYLPLAQNPRSSMEMVIEATSSRPASLISTLETSVAEIDPLATVFFTRPMDEVLHRRHWLHEALAAVFSVFGVVALLLSAVGLGGIVALAARSRRREYGIRLALGARPTGIVGNVLRSAALQTAVGLGIGLMLAVAIARLVASRVFGVDAWEPAVYLGVIVALFVATTSATLVPAIRAARTSPSEVLREP